MRIKKLICFLLLFTLTFTFVFNIKSYSESTYYLSQKNTDEMLLCDLLYDEYILNAFPNKKVDITQYKEFYRKYKNYIKYGDIPYENINSLKKQLSKYTLVKVSNNPKTDFAGAIFKSTSNNKTYYTVVFRGTNSNLGWANNIIEVVLDAYYNQRNDAISLTKDAINKASKNKVSEITFTGHSLGGFLTQTVGAKILNNNIKIPKSITWNASTFNGPGVFSPQAQKLLSLKSEKEINEYKIFYKTAVSKAKNTTSSYIKNFIIDGDIICEFGNHIGKSIVYGNHKSNLSKYHAPYNFHKYAYWYKQPSNNLILKSLDDISTNIRGRAPDNSKINLYINNKFVLKTVANSVGYFNINTKNLPLGSVVKIVSTDKNNNKKIKTTKVSSSLKINNVYTSQKNITGSILVHDLWPIVNTFNVDAYVGNEKIGSSKSNIKGNFKITIPKQKLGTKIKIVVYRKNYNTITATTTTLK